MTIIQREFSLGDFFFIDAWPFTDPMCVVTSPKLAHQIAQTNPLPRHPMVTQYVRPLVGTHSMLIQNGAEWKELRTMFRAGFSKQHLMTLVPMMVDHILVFSERLNDIAERQVVCQMEDLATKLTVDVIGRVVLDVELNSQTGDNELVEAFRKSMTWIPNGQQFNLNPLRPVMQKYYEGRMDDYIRRVLRMRYKGKEKRMSRNLIDLALDMYRQEGVGAIEEGDPNELFEQVAIDNRHPEALEKIRAEHDEVLGTDIENAARVLRSNNQLLNRLQYTAAVTKETLRLYPAAGSLRQGDEKTIFTTPDGQVINMKDRLIWLGVHSIHHRADLWLDPDEFHPERFLEGSNYSGHSPDAYRPFERGPRNCIGQELAMIEIQLVMALTLRQFDFKAAFDEWDDRGQSGPIKQAFGDEAYQVFSATAKPKGGMPMRVFKRATKTN
ncbi:Cytochrome P450 [Aspergillus sclerotialis]|uniref:Cytochrome P450 n=1 Tax=Aspergillus sclerotialis TaxID=2070753 RepID=A0A3A2ZKY6_9EURO|nr:Cytochrome P450 [Aspergillus sclerotialis]